ncbi:Nucleic acid-binding [Abeliophyllum distichum]|uniref:Nucleic acid-binding n=1 Tax=Abeliophyllum distichum TaxID=126358 RepID=A0ABD1TXE2_9LAMI
MDSFTLSTTTTANKLSPIQFYSHSFFRIKKSRILSFNTRKPRKLLVFASKDDSKLDQWDQMELKFGRMLGEDPKITYAKIMGQKSNPDMTYLEIEKLLQKKGSEAVNNEIEEIPFNVSQETRSTNSVDGLDLVRPMPRKGIEIEANRKQVETVDKKSSQTVIKAMEKNKSSVPNVILRKPTSFNEDDGKSEKSSRFGMKPNLSLKMGKEPQKDRFSDITLLKKPEPMSSGVEDEVEDNSLKKFFPSTGKVDDITLLEKPELMNVNVNNERERELSRDHTEYSSVIDVTENNLDVPNSSGELVNMMTDGNLNQSLETRKRDSEGDGVSPTELQADTQTSVKTFASGGPSETKSAETIPGIPMDTLLIGKPKILDRSVKATERQGSEVMIPMNPASYGNPLELENFLTTSPIKDHEDNDWLRAEELVKTGERAEVELISSSTRGFVVSFGSLIGFLPYRNLAARWKFLAFESWLRRKGLDPSLYRQNLGIIGKYEATSMTISTESMLDSKSDYKPEGNISSDMKLEDLLMIYDQEKLKFLSSFVGQKIKVGVALAERKSRRLIFSIKSKEKEELVEKKRSLMAKLSVGDVVKCCIKKITYFGIFVEVEGVPALIHQTEVSWDATLDPESYFKVGQIVEAKVHQLDFSLERIFLSLKEITPDPLMEALEAVVGDPNSLGGQLEAAEADVEWADVESLIKELQQCDGIESVSKGRYFLSPGLAPTFQVYMASMFENQYKLLARAGNRVQEVIVQTSMGKEELKSAILTCTNRVE